MSMSKAKQAELRAALVQELILLFEGAAGDTIARMASDQGVEDMDVELPFVNADAFFRWYEAVWHKYGGDELKWLFTPAGLSRFVTVSSAADILIGNQLYPVKK